MKKAIFFANYGSPYEGNFIVSLKMLESRLNEKNLSVTYVFPMRTQGRGWLDQLKNDNNEIYFISDNKAVAIKELSKIIKNAQFVHTHFLNMEQMLVLRIARIVSFAKCKVIHHIHNHYQKSSNVIKYSIKAWSLKSDLMLACGSGVCDSIYEADLKNNASYIDNGIDFQRLNQYGESVFDVNCCQILMFGFDCKRKGVDIAVKACERLHQAGMNIQLNISLSRNEDVVKNEINMLLGKIPSWITLLPPRNDIATYYKGADLFISPSREEGLCYSLIEAAYCGCIVVASDISGQNELEIPQIVWCKKEDENDLADKIQNMMSISADEKTIILNGQKTVVEQKYSISRWADEVEKYYRDHKIL